MRPDPVLDHGRRDVLAARGDDEFLLAPGDREVAVLVEGADVAGVEPAVGQRLGGRRLVLPVLLEDVLAVQQHLAVVRDAHHGARQRLADRTDLGLVPRVEGRGRTGLGQAVALQHREADAAEEVAEPLAQRGAAGDRVLAAPAEDRVQLAVDQLGEELVLELQAEGRTARGVQRTAVGDGRLGRRVEDLALAVGLGLGARRVVDLLEDARHTEDQRGPEGLELVGQVLDVRHAAQADRRQYGRHLHQAPEDVRGREEEQHGALAGAEERAEALHHVAAFGEEVAVGQHAALGAAGGARGVDDRRRVVGVGEGAALLDLGVGDLRAGGLQRVQRPLLDLPDLAQLRQPVAQRGHGRAVAGALHDDGDGAGVAEDPLDLLGGAGLVHGDGDAARGPDREVDQHPLVAGAGDQGDPVAGADAGRDEALGRGPDLREELGRGHVLPPAVGGLAAHDGGVGMLSGVAADEIRQVPVRRDLVQGRKAELAQDCCSSGRTIATMWTDRTLPTGSGFPIEGTGQMFRASHSVRTRLAITCRQ